ncbi:hypothetical protein N7510_001778 [Penicillium lagena]|uniref:uncharacterized protein n=1 Tax=Penicillium lagena TaxID=94218 RepID=UPI002541D329|nr:uncharacterized protein N7510_001778 [Penicillium lagena]KAJ5625469.1 hypothetical protein N7510_001778 [Penicillium lagena]
MSLIWEDTEHQFGWSWPQCWRPPEHDAGCGLYSSGPLFVPSTDIWDDWPVRNPWRAEFVFGNSLMLRDFWLVLFPRELRHNAKGCAGP